MTQPASRMHQTALKIPHVRRIWPSVSLRPIFVMLIAAAMLFAPFAMQIGSAMATTPGDHHAPLMDKGHCGDQPVEGEGKMMSKSCCIAMCTGVAVTAAAPFEVLAFARIADLSSLVVFHHSYLAKLATPPPRGA